MLTLPLRCLCLFLALLMFGCGGGGGVGSISGLQAPTSGGGCQTPVSAPARLAFVRGPARAAGEVLTLVQVEIQDAQGRRVLDSTLNVTLSVVQSGVPLLGSTTQSAEQGLASFVGLHIDVSGSYQLRATCPGLESATSGTLTITPAAPSRLVPGAPPGPGTGVRQPIVPPVQFALFDDFGNLASNFAGQATLTILSGPSAGVTGTTTAIDQGMAVFQDLRFLRAGTYRLQLNVIGRPELTQTLPDLTVASRGEMVYFQGVNILKLDGVNRMLEFVGLKPATIPTGTLRGLTALHSGDTLFQTAAGQILAFAVDPVSGNLTNGSELQVLSSIRQTRADLTDRSLVAIYGSTTDLRRFDVQPGGGLLDTGVTADIDGRPNELQFVDINGQQVLVLAIENGTGQNFLALPYDVTASNPFGSPGQGIYLGTGSSKSGRVVVAAQMNGQVVLYGGTNQANGPAAVQAFTTDAAGNLAKLGPQVDVSNANFVRGLAVANGSGTPFLLVSVGQDLVKISMSSSGALNQIEARLPQGSFVGSVAVDSSGTLGIAAINGPAAYELRMFDLSLANLPLVDIQTTQGAAESSLLVLPDPARQ